MKESYRPANWETIHQQLTTAETYAQSQTAPTPYFDIDKSVLYRQALIHEYGGQKGNDIALKTFIKDLETQAWELSGLPTPNTYNIFIDNSAGEPKIIHESNLHDKTDLLDVVTDKIRRGLEKKQALLYKESLINARIGDSVIWVSPKKTSAESLQECPYPDSQLVVAKKVDQKAAIVRQFQCSLDTAQMAKVLNALSGNELIKPGSSIDQTLLNIGKARLDISDEQVWRVMEQVSGVKILNKAPEEYAQLHEKITKSAIIGGQQLLDVIKDGVGGGELKNTHIQILLGVLGREVKSDKVHYGSDGSVSIDTSCGTFGSIRNMASGNKNENGKESIWCRSCGKENICNKNSCFSCGANLPGI